MELARWLISLLTLKTLLLKVLLHYPQLPADTMLTSYLRSDFDPEDIDNGAQSSDEESGEDDEVNTGREHYEKVGYVYMGICTSWYQRR